MLFVVLYIAAFVGANLTVTALGPAATPFVAFGLIGFDMVLRDRLQDAWQGRSLAPRMFTLIVAAGVLSFLLDHAAARIAVASIAAFMASSVVGALVYQAVRRLPWLARSNIANVAAAAVDSALFPLIAFGSFMPAIAALQFIAKVAGGMLWSFLLPRAGAIASWMRSDWIRVNAWCAGMVGLLGIALVYTGAQFGDIHNGWVYLGVLLWVAAIVAEFCLFAIAVLEAVRLLHPLVEVRR